MNKFFKHLFSPFRLLGFDWFISGLFLMILLAWQLPGPGVADGVISLKSLAGYGISVIFLLYGMRLSVGQLLGCLSHLTLHTIIQSVTFILFPLLVLPFRGVFQGGPYYNLWLGVFFLAALPSTVSSAVVMVSMARGNIPAAVFNASLSSIAGIFIAPLWMGMFVNGPMAFDMYPVLVKLTYQVLLPLITGLLLNRWLGQWAINARKITSYFDQLVILAIVYTSFSTSFKSGLFVGFSVEVILMLVLILVLLFVVVNLLIYFTGKRAMLSRPDMITALFCGSTKSLMHGSVMAKVMFGSMGIGGIVLLPVLIYHAFQLTATGIMARKFSVRKPDNDDK